MNKRELSIGEIVVCKEPMVLGTILGSCVSVCLFDERLQAGGMNHFMLPWPSELADGRQGHHGPDSIETLLRELISLGGSIKDMRAKIFGGGKVVRSFTSVLDIGKRNIFVAKETLVRFDIPIVRECTGGEHGIKVMFHTDTGRAFIREIEAHESGESVVRMSRTDALRVARKI